MLLQILPQTTQEGDNTKESQKYQNPPTLCILFIWKVPQEAMKNQRKILSRVNRETLGYKTQGHDLNWLDSLCPTRAHPLIHWGSNPRDIMGSNRICGSLLIILIRLPHEGNLSRGNSLGQGGLQALNSHLRGQGMRLKGR